MTDKTQPDSGRATGGIVEMLHARIAELEARVQELGAMARENRSRRIVELEAQLAAVGAGGVQALSAAPAGWKLVPVEPTNDMQKAADEWAAKGFYWPKAVYRAMLAASPTPPAEQPIGEVVVTKTRDGQIVSVTRQDDEGRILSVIATSDTEEQQAEESRVKLLAECRDAFPIPEPSSPLEVQWAAAMARPEEVPEYVRLCVAAMQAAPKAAPVATFEDARVQVVYNILVDDEAPPVGEHWEGFIARRIVDALAAPKAAPGDREQAAQRLRELAGISQDDVADPLHPRYIEGYKAGHTAGRKRAAPQQEAQEPALFVRKNSWRAGQWEAAPPDSPSYGLAWANQRQYVYAAPQPAPAPLSFDACDMATAAAQGFRSGQAAAKQEK